MDDVFNNPPYHTMCAVYDFSVLRMALERWDRLKVLEDLDAFTKGKEEGGISCFEVPLGKDILTGALFIAPTPFGEVDDLPVQSGKRTPGGRIVQMWFQRCRTRKEADKMKDLDLYALTHLRELTSNPNN